MSRRTDRGDARRERRAVGRWLAGVARDRRRDLVLAVSGALMRQCGFLAVPVILQFAIDDSVADGDPVAVWRWAGVLLVAAVLQFAGMCVWDWYANAADARAGAALRGRLLGRLWTVPPSRDDDSRDDDRDGSPTGAGDLVMRNGRDIDIVRVWVHGLPTWAVIGLTIAVLVPGILALDPLLLVVALATAPCLVALNLIYPRRFERASDAAARAHGARADVVDHLLRSAVTTRGIGAEQVLRDRHHERSAALVGHTVRTGGILARWTALGEGIPAVATAVGLLVGALAVSDNRLTVGGLVAFSGWMGTIGIAVQIGLTRLSQTVDARVAARRLLAVLGTDVPGYEASTVGPPTGAPELRMAGVTTRSSGVPVSLTVPVGAVLAITGPTGSGKSTLLRVLAGRDPAATGTVALRDVPLREWPAEARARSVVLVPQRPVVMAGTVRENLELGDQCDPDILWAALRATGLDRDFAADGLATVIGDGATALSGGQIQRLALARALVADPLVLLLDDVTSAVDADTEAAVVAALRAAAADRITVVTGHRPAVLSLATHTVSLSDAAAPVAVGGRP